MTGMDARHPWDNDPAEKTFYKVVSSENDTPFEQFDNRFVSFNRTNDPKCQTLLIILATQRLVIQGKVPELIENGLGDDFRSTGVNNSMLWLDQLAFMAKNFEQLGVPVYITGKRANDFARLAIALLNYDTRHLNDETRTLFSIAERNTLMDMIDLVDQELKRGYLPIDRARLFMKQSRELMEQLKH